MVADMENNKKNNPLPKVYFPSKRQLNPNGLGNIPHPYEGSPTLDGMRRRAEDTMANNEMKD